MKELLLEHLKGLDAAELFEAYYVEPLTGLRNAEALKTSIHPGVVYTSMKAPTYLTEKQAAKWEVTPEQLRWFADTLVAEFGRDHTYFVGNLSFVVGGYDGDKIYRVLKPICDSFSVYSFDMALAQLGSKENMKLVLTGKAKDTRVPVSRVYDYLFVDFNTGLLNDKAYKISNPSHHAVISLNPFDWVSDGVCEEAYQDEMRRVGQEISDIMAVQDTYFLEGVGIVVGGTSRAELFTRLYSADGNFQFEVM